jgi:hypothetical protein
MSWCLYSRLHSLQSANPSLISPRFFDNGKHVLFAGEILATSQNSRAKRTLQPIIGLEPAAPTVWTGQLMIVHPNHHHHHPQRQSQGSCCERNVRPEL